MVAWASGAVWAVAPAGAGASPPARFGPASPAPATDPVDAVSVGEQAYDYGFPLLEFLRVRAEQTSVRCDDHRGDAPVNTFSNVTAFADASERTVVAPNTDTLYSIAHLDLSRGPLVLSHPDMGGRYYSFAMLDPYTNVIDTPGSRESGGRAARILIRWAGHPRVVRGIRGRFQKVITSPYRRVWVIGRTLATDRRDQLRALAQMRRYRLATLDGRSVQSPAHCAAGTPAVHPTPTDGAAFLNALGAALAQNPPPARDAPLLRTLAPYGIGPGLSPSRAGLDPATLAALYQGVSMEAQTLTTKAKGHALTVAEQHGGWYEPEPDIGRYGTDYTFRAYIAAVGLGANTAEEAIYPTGVTDAQGALLEGGNVYELTFGRASIPPARYFWSLTMYDANGYLVANSENRYSVGPSHPPLVRAADGSVTIVISDRRPAQPGVNWLPAPSSGQFRLNLRLYGPSRAALSGAWAPPPVQNLGSG